MRPIDEPSELDVCKACKGSCKAGPDRQACKRCNGAGKLTKQQLSHSQWCSTLLDKTLGAEDDD